MNPTLIIVAGAAAVSILLIAVSLATSGTGAAISDRIERYGSKPGKTKTQIAPTGLTDILSSRAFSTLNKAVEQRDFGASLAHDLARADLRLRVGEYLLLWVFSMVAVPLAFLVLGVFVPGLRSPLALLGGVLIGAWLPRAWVSRRRKSRLSAFAEGLPDTITLISNALRAGSSFLQAVELVVRESRPPISTEFARVIREVNLGLPFDTTLDNMVRRVRSNELELLVTAISIHREVGGNLAEILDSIAFTIRERVRIKGEIMTLTAQQRLSGYVVGLLPVGLSAFLFVAAPQFMRPMFLNPPGVLGLPLGVVMLFVGGAMMFVGFLIIRRIVDIDI